jgi:hypothetical protein
MERMAELEKYLEIHNQIILKNGSWNRIGRLQSIHDLKEELSEPRRRARSIARIIEFSCRFAPNPSKPKQLGGVTMATDIVTSSSYFKVEVKDSTLEEWWRDQQSAAPFFYLMYVQKYPFFLGKIVGKRFALRYLARIDGRQTLLEFFSAYNCVAQQLSQRGYNYTPLQLPDLSETPSLSFCPFRKVSRDEREVLEAIDSTGSRLILKRSYKSIAYAIPPCDRDRSFRKLIYAPDFRSDRGARHLETLMSPLNFAGDVAEGTDAFSLVARGVLTMAVRQSFPVALKFSSKDGLLSGLLEIDADPQLLQMAFARGNVELDVLGVKFRAPVAGYAKDTQTLHVLAEPLFRALARAIDAQTGS